MKPHISALAAILLTASVSGGWAQSGDDIPLQPLPVPADQVDYTGSWNYSTFDHTVSGVCPAGGPMSGTLVITQEDALAQVLLESGAVCDPAFSCVFTGVVEDGDLVVGSSGIVDEEGGTVTNELRLYFFSETSGAGDATSVYNHPGGMTCIWSHRLMLSRAGTD